MRLPFRNTQMSDTDPFAAGDYTTEETVGPTLRWNLRGEAPILERAGIRKTFKAGKLILTEQVWSAIPDTDTYEFGDET